MGWSLSHCFALPLKCPDPPACGLAANATLPTDIVSANISEWLLKNGEQVRTPSCLKQPRNRLGVTREPLGV